MMNDLMLSSPVIALCLGAIVLLLFDAFVKSQWSRAWVAGLFVVLAFALLFAHGHLYAPGRTVIVGALYADPLFFCASAVLLAGLLVSIFLIAGKPKDESLEQPTELYALLLFSAAGAIVFCCAAELITFFVGLELMSLSLYCLCASSRLNRASAESALKYFILGSFSSAVLLFGIALLYGLTGTTVIAEAGAEVGQIDSPLIYFAATLFLVGLIFKLGGVPFHFWVPDVYEGAPTAVTAYMASVVKAASAIAAVRILWSLYGDIEFYLFTLLGIIAALTIIAGNLLALSQKSVKRMLAYSSVAHVGYLLLAFLALRHGDVLGAGAAILFYIVAYGAASLGAFGVVHALGAGADGGSQLSSYEGLAKRQPFLSFMMLLFLFSLGGLPPGMAGLTGKIYIFYSAIAAGHAPLVVLGVLGSAVSLYYYLRVVMYMYFLPPAGGDSEPCPRDSLSTGIFVCGVAVVVLGLFPSWLYEFASNVMQGL